MNTRKLLKAIFLGLSLTIITVSCVQNPKNEGSNTDSEDIVLTSKTKSTFIGDSRLKDSDILIKTYKGIMQLSGFVTQIEADRAVQLARTIKGVKAVNNALTIKPSYEIPPTTNIVKESSIVPVPTTDSVVNNLEEVKTKCKDLGFKPQSDKFGKCVLELTK